MVSKRALVYDPYLGTLGGGERYMFAVVQLLRARFEVVIGGSTVPSSALLRERGFPGDCTIIQMNDRAFTDTSGDFDLVVVVANGVPPRSRCAASVLILQFPFPERRPWRQAEARLNRRWLSGYQTVVYSEFVREWTQRRLLIPSRVIFPPIELGSFCPEAKRPLILSVGRFFTSDHTKRQGVLVEAYLELPEAVRGEWSLVLAGAAGGDRDSERYLHRLRHEAAGAAIEFAVNVPQARLLELLNEASIFWHAAGFAREESRPDRAEHFGMATVEAMSWGAVPMVFDDGGQREVVSDRVGYRWRTVPELVSHSVDLISDDLARRELALAAAAASEEYSVARFEAAFNALVDEVLDGVS